MAKRNLILLVVVVAIAVGLYELAPLTAQQDSVFQSYAPLVEVDGLVRQRYVEEVGQSSLVDGAIRGMMLQLDPYSGYIGPEEMESYRRRASGTYIGIGVQIGHRDDRLTVIAPIEQSPAIEAGVRAGDYILAIDGVPTDDLGVADADRLLEGVPGSSVELTLRHIGNIQVETISIARAPVTIHTVKGYTVDHDGQWGYSIDPEAHIAYVRISYFHEKTAEEFSRALQSIKAQGSQALILDLRFNPGGSLRSAVGIVDRFLDEGVILSTVTRHEALDVFRARHEGTLPPWPLAVLVNGGSASSSEIVSGALQDHKRATIVGTRSFGKGVVQSVIPLQRQTAALSLTVAHYRLPNGRIIHKNASNQATNEWGVIPDRIVNISPAASHQILEERQRLDLVAAEQRETRVDANAEPTPHEMRHVALDPQLQAALQAIRAKLQVTESSAASGMPSPR